MEISTSRPLWSGPAPGAFGDEPTDIPTLTACLPPPDRRNGASMLVLPGGGYGGITAHEGIDYARWLAAQGVCCHVLVYRLGSHGYRHPCMLNDAARALRLVRLFARNHNLDTARIGVIGSSAGGHLGATLLTKYDAGRPDSADPVERESSRPDLGILVYPVITMDGPFVEKGSCRRLLGENPSPELRRELSAEEHVTADTPPTFLWHAVDDHIVAVENSFLFASALRRAGVPFDLHVYEKGAHGHGLGLPGRPVPPWADACLFWLRSRHFI